jgi:uncharacterized membrane protein
MIVCDYRGLYTSHRSRGGVCAWRLVVFLMAFWVFFALVCLVGGAGHSHAAWAADSRAAFGLTIDQPHLVVTEARKETATVPAAEALSADERDVMEAEPQYETATVVAVRVLSADEREVMVLITSGVEKGREVRILQALTGQASRDLTIKPGDGVMVAVFPSEDGAGNEYQLADWQRGRPLTILAIALGLAIVVVGGLRGIKTLLVLGLASASIMFGLIPLTLAGAWPLHVSIVLALVVALVTTGLTSGWGRKSLAAVLGTLAAVATTALLAHGLVDHAHLSGLAGENPDALVGQVINFPGFLAASMVIGSLGIVLDLALSISAAVCEVAETNPAAPAKTLLQTGWQVGQDLLSTAGNTLLMAYIGCFMPLMLALGAQPLDPTQIIHSEVVANAAGSLLVGLFGLVISIPYTTWIVVALHARTAKRQKH